MVLFIILKQVFLNNIQYILIQKKKKKTTPPQKNTTS